MSNTLEFYFTLFVAIQLLHSLEEIFTGFDRRWRVWKMSRRFFVTFEIIFSLFLITLIFWTQFPFRETIMYGFNLLMFANGVWHLMWAGIEKKYVPGLFTAPLFIIVFILFYIQLA